jgi:hypothetical protein
MAAAAAKAAEKEKVSAAAAEEGRRAVSGRAVGRCAQGRLIYGAEGKKMNAINDKKHWPYQWASPFESLSSKIIQDWI